MYRAPFGGEIDILVFYRGGKVMAFVYVGGALALIGTVWLLIEAFRTSIMWGVGCLLLAPISLLFLFAHWQDAKNPFFLTLSGVAIVYLGGYVLS